MSSLIFFSLEGLCAIVVLRQEVWKEERVSDRLTGREVHLARKPPLPLPLPPHIFVGRDNGAVCSITDTDRHRPWSCLSYLSYIFYCWLVPFPLPLIGRQSTWSVSLQPKGYKNLVELWDILSAHFWELDQNILHDRVVDIWCFK